MAIYTRVFPTEDDYEEWLGRSGAKVNVLTIKSKDAPPTKSGLYGKRQVTVTYRATDPRLGRQRSVWITALELIALIFVVYFAFVYETGAVNPTVTPAPLKLDNNR